MQTWAKEGCDQNERNMIKPEHDAAHSGKLDAESMLLLMRFKEGLLLSLAV